MAAADAGPPREAAADAGRPREAAADADPQRQNAHIVGRSRTGRQHTCNGIPAWPPLTRGGPGRPPLTRILSDRTHISLGEVAPDANTRVRGSPATERSYRWGKSHRTPTHV